LDLFAEETFHFKVYFLLIDTEFLHQFGVVAEGDCSNREELQSFSSVGSARLSLEKCGQIRHLQSLLQLLVEALNKLAHVRLRGIDNFLSLLDRLSIKLYKFAAETEASTTLGEEPLGSVGSWCLSLSCIVIDILFIFQ
jgi:hypothetical protein